MLRFQCKTLCTSWVRDNCLEPPHTKMHQTRLNQAKYGNTNNLRSFNWFNHISTVAPFSVSFATFMMMSAEIMTSLKFWWRHFVCIRPVNNLTKFHGNWFSGSGIKQGGFSEPPQGIQSPQKPSRYRVNGHKNYKSTYLVGILRGTHDWLYYQNHWQIR